MTIKLGKTKNSDPCNHFTGVINNVSIESPNLHSKVNEQSGRQRQTTLRPSISSETTRYRFPGEPSMDRTGSGMSGIHIHIFFW